MPEVVLGSGTMQILNVVDAISMFIHTYMLSLPDSPGDSRNLVRSPDLPVGSPDLPVGRMNLPDFYQIEIRLKNST